MMKNEFPMLQHDEVQNEFLKDWWTRKKLFKSNRQRGKTTVLLCELKRFMDHNFDTIILTPTKRQSKHFVKNYKDLFGEVPVVQRSTYDRFEREFRGSSHVDAVIMDNFGETTFDKVSPTVTGLNPIFIRASVDNENIHNIHYLNDEDGSGFFDSVYEA